MEQEMGYKKTTKYKGITRVDREPGHHPDGRRITSTHGYFVRVTWKGETYRKFFSDSVYGDRLGALEAAKEWRIAKEKEIGKPRTERQVYGIANTDTGIIGIRRIVSGPWGHEAYEATWINADGTVGRTSYSITKNGERKALKLAIEARNRGEQERLNSRFPGTLKRRSRRYLESLATGQAAPPSEPPPAPAAPPKAAPRPALQERAQDEWPDTLDLARFEPPSFSLPSFGKKPLSLDDYDGT
jgi:hypothetical protein